MNAVVFEEHSSVLPHWAAAGLRAATVVVLDAHLDLQHLGGHRIERLRRCGDAAALRALESPHPFAVSPDACFGIEDFLYPAARLGLVGRIVWVAPPHVLRRGFGAALQRLVQMEGVSLDDIESFGVASGGWVEGRLMGIPLAVCTIDQLARMALPAGWQLDIDVDYFVELPGDRVWADPVDTLACLRALDGCPATLTISRSVGSGFTPLRLRFLGDLLAAAWVDATGPLTAPWRELLQAEYARAAGQPAACRAHCAAVREPAAALAAAHHLAAEVAPAPEQARASRAAAACADAAYAPDLARDIAAAHSRHLRCDAGRLLHWQRALAGPQPTAVPSHRGPAWVMLGLLQCAAGRLDEAQAADAQAVEQGHAHPDLALELGGALAGRGDVLAAAHNAARAHAHAATRVRASALWFRIATLRGDAAEARRWSGSEAEATPANPGAWQRLAQACNAIGDGAAAQAAERRAGQLVERLQAAAVRLAVALPATAPGAPAG